jgi:hypothetical protein
MPVHIPTKAGLLLSPPLQFDVLWDQLTGREHLELFAAVKGEQPGLAGRLGNEYIRQQW